MPIGINTILRTAEDVKFKLETNLDNTLTQPHALDDACSGLVPLSGHDSTIKYKSNSAVTISSHNIPGEQSSVLLAGDISQGASMPEPYTSGKASRNIGNAVMVNTNNKHKLKHRRFKGAPLLASIGGLLNKGKPTENNMVGADYEAYLVGKFGNGNTNNEKIDVSLFADSNDLSPVFPPASYLIGESKGQGRPYIFGRSYGQVAKPQGEGVFEFHYGGEIDLTESVFPRVPYVHFGDGYEFYDGTYTISSGTFLSSFTFDNYAKGDFDWVNTSAGVESTSAVSVTVTSNSDKVSITANDDNTITISKLDSANRAYCSSDFEWSLTSSTTAQSDTGLSVTATTDGAIEILEVGGRWFKIHDTSNASTGGTCSLDFGGSVANLILIVRQQDLTGVSNWSTTPDSVVAENDSRENYVVSFTDLPSGTVSFDYARSTDADLVAIWVQSVTVYDIDPVTIDIEFDDPMYSVAIDHSPSNASFIFDSFNLPRDSALEASTGADFAFENHFNKLSINALIGHGSCVVCFVDVNERNDALYDYGGGVVDGNFIIAAPEASPNPFDFTQINFPSFPSVSGYKYQVEIEARLSKTDISEANIFLQIGSDLYVSEKVSAEWRTFKYLPTDSITDFSIETMRGTASYPITNGGVTSVVSFTNSDEDHSVEIKIRVKPINHTSEINISSTKGDVDSDLISFYVSDIYQVSADLPPGVALYNNKGRFLASKEYPSLFGDFIGPDSDITCINSIRKISELATGADIVTSSIAGRRVGFVIDQQKPWAEHVAKISAGLDYVAIENAVEDGLSIIDRYKFDQYPADLVIKSNQVVANSVKQFNQPDRQYRYLFSYREDKTDSSRTKTYKSNFGYTGDVGEKEIDTVLYNESDVIEQANTTIVRDSVYSDLIELSLVNQGYDFVIGDVLKIEHEDIPPRTFCEVLSKTHADGGDTDIKVKAYRYN